MMVCQPMPPSDPLRIFISYAHKDGAALAQYLQSALTKEGFDAWLDTQRLHGGAVWTMEIEREIDNRQVTIALLSPGSYASEICRAEQLRALDKGNRVIPVLAVKGADPACDTHHGDARKSREAQERIRAQNRKQEEQRETGNGDSCARARSNSRKSHGPAAESRSRTSCPRVHQPAPAGIQAILSQRHSPIPINGKEGKGEAEIGNTLKNLDEAGYSRLLVELSLLDAAHNGYARDAAERLEAVAKRYRVNAQRIAESVAAEFAARRKKRDERKNPVTRSPKPAGRKVAAPR
jgi:hypothetical protein